ncbi:MAG: mechanosensitive ion channel, partial [Deltaproteobacteria bacterium]|nr:mechanosensitive ion channel [Deltaproteobacteria bacterium]
LEEDILPRASLPRGVPYAVSTAVRYVILIIGFLLAVAAAGLDLSRFALMAGALGVGIGIGLQDVVNNLVSGLILLFERPIQTGDTVEVGGVMGEVRRIGIRSSTVRTWDGAEVVIPNARFISDQFVNWTLSDRQRRMTIKLGVKYGTDPDRVLEILLERASAHPDVLDTPEPVALFNGFGDSSLDFEVRAWTLRADAWRQVQSDITIFIDAALKEAGIEIPFPQRDLHLRSVDPGVSIK